MGTLRTDLNNLVEEMKQWRAERAQILVELEAAKAGSQKAEQLQQQLEQATQQLAEMQTQLEAAQAKLLASGGAGDPQEPLRDTGRRADDPPSPKNPPTPTNPREVVML